MRLALTFFIAFWGSNKLCAHQYREGTLTFKHWKWALSSVVAIIMMFGFFFGTAGAASNYQVEVNKQTNKLILYKDGVVYKEYPVATGRTEELTPEGTFTMVVKINQPGWKGIPGGHPDNPLGEKWLGLSVNGDAGRTYGIHGTNKPESIGTHASSGCIRMAKDDLLELYGIIPEGTPVWIHKGSSTGKWEGDPSFAVQPTSGKVKVTVNLANVRTGPSIGAFIITQEKTGTMFEVIGFVKDWYQIQLSSGKIAFIHNSTVQKVTDEKPPVPPVQTDAMKGADGTVKITVSVANIRSNPSLQAPVVQKVKNGTKLTLTGEGKEWYRVRLSSGYTAYVHKTVAQKIETTQVNRQYVTVTVNLANIRSAPSLTAPILQRVAKGTKIEKVGTNGDWYILKLSDQRTGFIHKSIVQ